MAETGFTPQWVELQREIRHETEALKKDLGNFRHNFAFNISIAHNPKPFLFDWCFFCDRQSLGSAPLSEKKKKEWEEKVFNMEKRASDINKKIQKFNLIVPSMHHQKYPVNLVKIAETILASE